MSRRKLPLYIPNWFSVEIKTGVSSNSTLYSSTTEEAHMYYIVKKLSRKLNFVV